MSDTFKILLTTPGFQAGPFLQGPGGLYHQALGHGIDIALADITRRHLAAFPAYATDETLGEIARDRDMPIFPEMPRAVKEEVLLDWLPAHIDAGLPIGILKQVRNLFYPEIPRVRLVSGNSARALWHTLEEGGSFSSLRVTPSNWDWDSAWALGLPEPTKIHRFFLIIDAPASYLPQPIPASSTTQSLGCQQISVRQALNIRLMAERFKSVGSVLWGWILSYDPSLFDPVGSGVGYPDGTWYKAADPGTGEYNWPEACRVNQLLPPLI